MLGLQTGEKLVGSSEGKNVSWNSLTFKLVFEGLDTEDC
jgi:hypothetical protein